MRAVVMGGTSGIGLATAGHLASAKFDVTVTGRDPVKLADLEGRFAGAERVDGTDRDAVAAFFKRLGPFEHLVLAFSPGPVGLGPIREISPDDFETAFTGKLFGYVHAIREAQVTGSITMISAASARAALPGTVAGGGQRRDRADGLAAGGRARAGPRQRRLTRHHRHPLVVVPAR
jgi:NAD(P)-dependent dehydrogenase (short-subunit alcohol dehydrogenase family)